MSTFGDFDTAIVPPALIAPHGTRARYEQHCDCPDCKKACADYSREYRRKRAAAEGRQLTARRSYLRVACWCEATFVRVLAEDVRAGQTDSCGRPGCEA